MRCAQCGNEDPRYFVYDKGMYYCRRCISFSRCNVGETIVSASLKQAVYHCRPKLKFDLTNDQKRVSQEILMHLKNGKDVFVYAATGAGKTECTFDSICYYLSLGKKVAFSISRRQVVLEIAERLRLVFPSLSVIAVTQGYTSITDGDLIVCTMHQLYRYPDCFDLLIMDEVDAFPYVGNQVLQTIACRSCRGQKLYLSATPDEQSMERIQKKEMEMVCLFKRPHGYPLVVPKVYCGSLFFQVVLAWIFCFHCVKEGKQVLLFVPRRQDCVWMKFLFSRFFSCEAVHSNTKEKDEILDAFREHRFELMITTTLLERGITVPSVQVLVLQADHVVFTTASLIQIFGRVGRSFKDPTGKGLCLCQRKNKAIQDCINELCQMNTSV